MLVNRNGNVIDVTDDTFDSEVLHHDGPVLTDFTADWCAPCRQIAPIVGQLADELSGRLKVAKLDVDANQGVAMRYGVQSIPTLILFKNGHQAERVVGFTNKENLLRKLSPHLG
jgi:thioredoxin 1